MLDQEKLLVHLSTTHKNALADLKSSNSEWSEALMWLSGKLITRIERGDFNA